MIQHYQKLYGSLNQKQEGKYSLNNNKLRNENKPDDTTARRVNEHSYIISFDKLQQETKFHSGKSTLQDIHIDLDRNKENLLNSQGFIYIKEYTLDGYECRCRKHNDLLNNEKIDNEKYFFNYKLKF